jgi:beta-mannosidase
LSKAKLKTRIKLLDEMRAEISFTSTALQHRFAFDLAGIDYRADDNFIELYPDEPKSVIVTLTKPCTAAELRSRLSSRSLVDTY